MTKQLSAADLMEQRFEALASNLGQTMSPAEEEALLASMAPAPRPKPLEVPADEFTLNGRRVIAPLLTKNGDRATVCQIKRLSEKHMAMMDYMLANPAASMLEIAEAFGVTLAWFSTVRNSDLFRQTYAERRRIISERQQEIVSEKLAAAANKGLDRMIDLLDDEETGPNTVIAITKLAMEHSGMSQAKSTTAVTVNNVTQNTAIVVDDEKSAAIRAARERILARAQAQNAERSLNHELPDIVGEVIR